MQFIISNNSDIPIYEQIKRAIKKEISLGNLHNNDLLPSIRSMAKDLHISVLTVKKAYDELEQEGYIKTVHGKGSYISNQNQALLKEEQLKEIEKHLEQAITIAKIANLSKEELLSVIEYLYEEDQNE